MSSKTFTYVRYDDDSVKLQEHFKSLFEQIESEANKSLTASRPRALLMTKLEEAYMWVGKAIRDDQIARNSQTAHVPERGEDLPVLGHDKPLFAGEK